MKRLGLFVCLCFYISLAGAQQNTAYNKYIFNNLYINPAYAGYKGDLYLQSFYKSQWTGFSGAPASFALAADGAINSLKVGLGLIFSSDNIGAQSYVSAYGNYAYHIQMGEDPDTRLSFGLGLGFIQNGIDGNKLNGVENGDSTIPLTFESVLLPDARAGVMYSDRGFFAGFSMDNIIAQYFKKDNSIFAIVPKPHYYLTFGGLVALNEDTKLKPSVLFSDYQAGLKSVDVGLAVCFVNRLWLGATYRADITDASMPGAGLQKDNSITATISVVATDNIRLGYAFDYSTTALGNTNYGSHELSLGIYLGHKKAPFSSDRRNF